MIKTLTANQNPSCFNELEYLKPLATRQQRTLNINRALWFIGVDATIIIVTVIVLGVNGL